MLLNDNVNLESESVSLLDLIRVKLHGGGSALRGVNLQRIRIRFFAADKYVLPSDGHFHVVGVDVIFPRHPVARPFDVVLQEPDLYPPPSRRVELPKPFYSWRILAPRISGRLQHENLAQGQVVGVRREEGQAVAAPGLDVRAG